MAITPFPEDKQVSFDVLMKPVKNALLQLYTLKRTSKKEAKYNGHGLHFSVGACSPDPESQLNKEGLAYDRERDRKPIDVILRIAFQLGYSNGFLAGDARNTLNESTIKSLERQIFLLEKMLKKKKN